MLPLALPASAAFLLLLLLLLLLLGLASVWRVGFSFTGGAGTGRRGGAGVQPGWTDHRILLRWCGVKRWD
ncbi:unnamed protein product [Miscanthus lutarioriparius]|uniref:Uncharacterized protein n=1 Tax=Miscanthus lutarioriparius TaxID=422564 RepID=A0A811PAW8_9POAL|nr:unnamed protein product [Miscanthus lutarioriparius]